MSRSSAARRLLRGLCHDGIARRQRRSNLPGEDRERKIPWADARKDPSSVQCQAVRFASRPRERLRGKAMPRFGGVVAAEVDRLAHFGDAVVPGLAGLPREEGDEAEPSKCIFPA